METTKNVTLEDQRDMARRLVDGCTDKDLLDLICRLLMQPGTS